MSSDEAPAAVEKYLDMPVARETLNTVQLGTVPICIIPGVMGSRLRFPQLISSVDWDPDSNLGMLYWASAPADQRTRLFRSHADVISEGRADPSVALSYYGPILDHLRDHLATPMQTPVFAIGYDWRQSNDDSGRYVAQKVNDILKNNGASKAILVTHSMGGLVARAALKMVPGFADSVLGVVHTVQPANGAVKEYSNLIAGPDEPGVQGFFFERILGPSATEFLALMTALPGPVQLLPNKKYALRTAGMTVNKPSNLQADPGGGRWLEVFVDNESQEYSSNIYDAYAQYEYPGVLKRSAAPGFFWFQWNAMMNQMESNLSLAEQFHDRLGGYMHPLTKVVAANQNSTLIGLVLSHSNGILFSSDDCGTIMGPGDGTVPLASQTALAGTPGWPDPTMYSAGEHAQIFGIPPVCEYVRRCITAMVVQYSFQVNVAGP